tara:strand:+ start:247 stop:747 length:501 start_codon:yes stop_codon:yes gene_type:complete
MSQLKVNSIVPVGGLPSGANGGIIQTIQTFKGDTTTTTSSSFVDISGMSATITPSSNSNKVLVRFTLHISTGTGPVVLVNLLRGTTNIAQPTVTDIHPSTLQLWADADHMITQTYEFLDSPATTSATTYKLQWRNHTGSFTAKLNGYFGNTNYNVTSTMTLQEITT